MYVRPEVQISRVFDLFVSYFFCTKIVYHSKRKGKNYLNDVFQKGLYCEQITN